MTTIHLSHGSIHIHISSAEDLTETSGRDDGWSIATTHHAPEKAAPLIADADYEEFLNSYE